MIQMLPPPLLNYTLPSASHQGSERVRVTGGCPCVHPLLHLVWPKRCMLVTAMCDRDYIAGEAQMHRKLRCDTVKLCPGIQGESCPCTPFLSHLLITTKLAKTIGPYNVRQGRCLCSWISSLYLKDCSTPNFEEGNLGEKCAIYGT